MSKSNRSTPTPSRRSWEGEEREALDAAVNRLRNNVNHPRFSEEVSFLHAGPSSGRTRAAVYAALRRAME